MFFHLVTKLYNPRSHYQLNQFWPPKNISIRPNRPVCLYLDTVKNQNTTFHMISERWDILLPVNWQKEGDKNEYANYVFTDYIGIQRPLQTFLQGWSLSEKAYSRSLSHFRHWRVSHNVLSHSNSSHGYIPQKKANGNLQH